MLNVSKPSKLTFNSNLRIEKTANYKERIKFIKLQVGMQYEYLLKNTGENNLLHIFLKDRVGKKIFENLVLYNKKLTCKKADNFLVFGTDDKLCAGISCKKSGEKTGYLSTLFLNKDECNKDVARVVIKLKQIIRNFIEENHIETIKVSCVKYNKKLMNFYEKIGFKVYKRGIISNKMEISGKQLTSNSQVSRFKFPRNLF